MNPIGTLIRVTDQEAAHRSYREGLQAMWEARWVLLGAEGQDAWYQCHGALPPHRCPILNAAIPLHGVRRLLRENRSARFGTRLQRFRMATLPAAEDPGLLR